MEFGRNQKEAKTQMISRIKRKILVGLPTLIMHKFPPYAYMDSWYVQSFNGQIRRTAKIVEIAENFKPTSVVETGTFLGSSTAALSSLTDGPVYTLEINKKFAQKAKSRFVKNHSNRRIELITGDSTAILSTLLPKLIAEGNSSRVMFYLDAHWEERIPTYDELTIIDAHLDNWIVIIDDFKVEHDLGYGYDNYPSGSVDLSVIPRTLDVEVWVPKGFSKYETGAKRGTAYVFSEKSIKIIPKIVFENLSRVK